MNIPEIWHVGVACGLVGLLAGVVVGFCIPFLVAADLSRSLSEIVTTPPKGK